MSIAHHKPLLISQHKRTSFDQNGSVDKMEIIRSIRKKQTSPSFLPNLLQAPNHPKQQHSHLKQLLQYFIWAIIILCTALLILKLSGLSFSLNKHQSINYSKESDKTDLNYDKNSESIDRTKDEFDLTYSAFVGILQDVSPSQKQASIRKRMKIEEFKLNFLKNDEKEWKQFLHQLTQSMECELESGKIVCSKTLSP